MSTLFKKTVILLILLPYFVWFASCDDNITNTDSEAKESFSFEVAIESRFRLRLNSFNGTISITGISETDSVVISGEKRVESENAEDAEEHLKELEVRVQGLTDEVFIETIQPQETHGSNYMVDYTITLPNHFEVLVNQINGFVAIDSITNSVSVATVNGDVNLQKIFGSTFVELINGSIDSEVTLPLDGTINMGTTNGAIELDIPQNTSAEFSANIGTGNINLINLVLLNEVSTPRSLNGTLGDGQGTIFLKTVNGNISVSGF